MSYHERRAFGSMISTLVVSVAFFVYVLQRFPQGNPYSAEVFHFWGTSVFILIPLSVVAEIIIQIVSSVVTTVATREKESHLLDERDRAIQLRALRNTIFLFVVGFFLAMASLVFDQPPSVMFMILFFSGFVSGMFGYLSQLYFYRRGY